MKKICVIIPIYKEKLSEEEAYAVDRSVEVLKNRKLYFVAPAGMNSTWYESKYPQVKWETFATKYFKNIFMYSRLLLSEHFYSRFSEYEYMLVVQPDVWILSEDDKLDYFMQFSYDYIGAPWKQEEKLYPVIFKGMNHLEKVAKKWGIPFNQPLMARVGNGGMSLRKISAMLDIIKNHPVAVKISKISKRNNEDGFLCYYLNAKDKYRLPTSEFAEQFAAEQTARQLLEEGKIPFSVHAYEKRVGDHNIMREYMEHRE